MLTLDGSSALTFIACGVCNTSGSFDNTVSGYEVHDPIPSMLYSACFGLETRKVSEIFGNSFCASSPAQTYTGHFKGVGLNESRDRFRFTQITSNIKHLLSDFRFRNVLEAVPGENPVKHFNLHGAMTILPNINDLEFPVTGTSDVVVYDTSTSCAVFDRGTEEYEITSNLFDVLDSLSASINQGDLDESVSSNFRRYRNAQIDMYEKLFSYQLHFCEYHPTAVSPLPWFKVFTFEVSISFEVEFPAHSFELGTRPLSDFIHFSSTYYIRKFQSISGGKTSADPLPFPYYDLIDFEGSFSFWESVSHSEFGLNTLSTLLAIPGSISAADGLLGWSPNGWEVRDLTFGRFEQSFERCAGQFLGPCNLACLDAFDVHVTQSGNDHVEALIELIGVFETVEIVPMIRALSNRKKRKIGSLVWELLNLASSGKLLYSLGVSPTISDAFDTADKAKKYVAKWKGGHLFGEVSSRGKVNLPVPDDFLVGFTGVRAEYRAKVEFYVDPDSFVPYLVPLKAFNLLPSLSSLWNLVPMSFVLDWFTNFGDKVQYAEDSLFSFFAYQVDYCVCSYKITYDFPSDALLSKGLGLHSEDDLPGYHLYRRFTINGAIPALIPTTLPIFGEGGVPDWSLAGSLVFKFL